MSKKTLVIGASPKPNRYSYMAVESLKRNGHEVIPLGKRSHALSDWEIIIGKPMLENIDTISLYLNPTRQKEYYEYLVSLKPSRVIFNPGTENEELKLLLNKNGIRSEEACTLVLLNIGQY